MFTENSKLQFIQEHLKSVSGNVLLCSNDSDMNNLQSNKKLKVLSNSNQILSDFIDSLLLNKTFDNELLKFNENFDSIIVNNLFEEIKHPKFFLHDLISVLNDNGSIICSFSNFFHITNILNLLLGNICHNKFFNSLQFYDLDKFLLFLNENNMHVTKISRIKNNFSSDNMNIDETLIPSRLIDMIQKIPDYDTSEYVLVIGKGKTLSSENLDFVSQFPKNYLLPQLQEFFEKSSQLEKSVSDKDEVMHGYENSIKEQKEVMHGYENSIQEQKKYIENLEKNIQDLQSHSKKLKKKFWSR